MTEREIRNLKYDEVDLLVLVGSEYANGDPTSRRWSEVFAGEDLLKFMCLALRSILVVDEHAASVGSAHDSIVQAVGHSLVVCVRDFGAEATFAAIEDTLRYSNGKKFNAEHFEIIVGSVCQRMMREFLRPCADDCDRVIIVDPKMRPTRRFWERYRAGANSDGPEAAEQVTLAFQPRFPCNVGLPTDSETPYPLWSEPRMYATRFVFWSASFVLVPACNLISLAPR